MNNSMKTRRHRHVHRSSEKKGNQHGARGFGLAKAVTKADTQRVGFLWGDT